MTFEFRQFRLELRFSFFAVCALMLLCSDSTVALLCFGSALLHECGHLLFLLTFSAGVRALSFGAGGIVIERSRGFCGTARECVIALGGVFVNLTLCLTTWICYRSTRTQPAAVFCIVNGALAALNLLPVCSLDCYRVADLLLQRRGTERREQLLRHISFAAVCAACLCSALLFLFGVRNLSLLAVCFYLMLLHGKRSA